MTVGIKLGRAIGATAATVVEGAKSAGKYTGQFGQDVVSGTKAGYQDRLNAMAKARMQAKTEPLPAPAPVVQNAVTTTA